MPDKFLASSRQLIDQEKSVLNVISADTDLFEKARQLQNEAAKHGFDWPSVEPVFEKLKEEIAELKAEIIEAFQSEHVNDIHRKRMQDELGDVLFCCVNLARFMGVSASEALHGTNEKFERRFRFIESRALEKGKALSSMSLEELDHIWDEAKTHGF